MVNAKNVVAKITGTTCECGASVAHDMGIDHEKTPQHLAWLEKVTKPEPLRPSPSDKEIERLPQDLRMALSEMDNPAIPVARRPFMAARRVRAYYADMGYSNGVPVPDGLPQTVRGFMDKFGIPVVPNERELRRMRERHNLPTPA